jgi:hypothetical protein
MYKDRYCAFVDILGFSELMSELDTGAITETTIKGLLDSIHRPPDLTTPSLEPFVDLKAQSISDAVAISTVTGEWGLIGLFFALRELSLTLLHKGYFTRGAVCRGPLYHDDGTVFGEALLRAYRLESEIVRFPRIMITKEVVDDARRIGENSLVFSQIMQAPDGPHCLNVLYLAGSVLARHLKGLPPHPSRSYTSPVEFYGTIGKKLQERLDAAVDNPRHFEKAQWFAAYWNASIVEVSGHVRKVQGPGLGDA